jgi:hypothetical protein
VVKALVTSECNSHRFNQDYETLLVLFDGTETNVRPFGVRMNWQPTDAEVMGLVRRLAELSPTFAQELISYAVDLNPWTGRPNKYGSSRKRKPASNLAEMLL